MAVYLEVSRLTANQRGLECAHYSDMYDSGQVSKYIYNSHFPTIWIAVFFSLKGFKAWIKLFPNYKLHQCQWLFWGQSCEVLRECSLCQRTNIKHEL